MYKRQTWDFVEFISTGSLAGHLQPLPQYCGPDVNTLRSGFLKIQLMMAAIGAVETFGLAINHGPRPNSPDNLNHTTDTGCESLRNMLGYQVVWQDTN